MDQVLADGVTQIDTLHGGWEQVTAAYLIEGPAPVLIETGSRNSAGTLLAALDRLGIGPHDLAAVVVTHIHLDHAGGVGDVARAFPEATVHVHERGARHLVDPGRLLASAERVFGPALDDLYGRPIPTEAGRVRVLADGDRIVIGPGRALHAVESPGHARHHLGLHDDGSGILFAGDAVGVRLPGMDVVRPATPPPDVDVARALHSLDRFAARRPTGVALAHYGLVADPAALLEDAATELRRWADVAEAAWAAGEDVTGALEAAFGDQLRSLPSDQAERLETLNGIPANAAGLERWLATRSAA